jgi:Tfp pilus assembly protein PilX
MSPEQDGGAEPRLAPTPLGNRGIALPLALLGLVAVTLMVVTVLVTSGTEMAVSNGQSSATRSLFTADGALQGFVAQQAGLGSGTVNKFSEGVTAYVFNGGTYNVTQARLARSVVMTSSGGTSTETWSLIANPATAGRGVGAFIQVQRTLNNASINVNAGFTSGGNVTIGGSSLVSDGETGQTGCSSPTTSPYSVEVTSGATINAGADNVQGATHVSATTKAQLVAQVLGTNVTLDTLMKLATIRFGPAFYGTGTPEWPNNIRPNDDYSLTAYPDSLYNWGCPAADVGNSNCHGGQNRFVVVGIDARNLNQQTVKLNGDWGQGILVINHGSLDVQGNFVFRGIVLVDQDLKMTGTGQGDGKIEGTIVAFGDSSAVTDDVRGNAMIRYNKCSITDAQNALNKNRIDSQPQVLSRSPFAWFELVR